LRKRETGKKEREEGIREKRRFILKLYEALE
jgi:hypothetical protein